MLAQGGFVPLWFKAFMLFTTGLKSGMCGEK